jgi:hypothetical protein
MATIMCPESMYAEVAGQTKILQSYGAAARGAMVSSRLPRPAAEPFVVENLSIDRRDNNTHLVCVFSSNSC